MKKWMMLNCLMLMVSALVTVPRVSATETDAAVQATVNRPEFLRSGQTMNPGDYINPIYGSPVPPGYSFVVFQYDGNVVQYYVNYDGTYRVLWATHTAGTTANRFVMQTDGNLVLYDTANRVLWASDTQGHPGASLHLSRSNSLSIVYYGDVLRRLY